MKVAEPKNQQAWFNHIETWEQSGLAQKQYCNEHDLVYSQFGKYRTIYLEQQKNSPSITGDIFVEMSVVDQLAPEPTPSPITTPCDIVATLPNNIKLSVPQGFDRIHLSALAKVLVAI